MILHHVSRVAILFLLAYVHPVLWPSGLLGLPEHAFLFTLFPEPELTFPPITAVVILH